MFSHSLTATIRERTGEYAPTFIEFEQILEELQNFYCRSNFLFWFCRGEESGFWCILCNRCTRMLSFSTAGLVVDKCCRIQTESDCKVFHWIQYYWWSRFYYSQKARYMLREDKSWQGHRWAVRKHVHWVWVVDHEGLLQGLVSLTDMLRVIRETVLHADRLNAN